MGDTPELYVQYDWSILKIYKYVFFQKELINMHPVGQCRSFDSTAVAIDILKWSQDMRIAISTLSTVRILVRPLFSCHCPTNQM